MWGHGITCREGELDLLLDHLEGHKVMLLIEAPIVEQQPVTLLGGKPEWEWGGGREWGTHPDAGTQPPNQPWSYSEISRGLTPGWRLWATWLERGR